MPRTIEPTMKVKDIAIRYPELLSELERLGIDYCCGGDRALSDVAAAAGVDPVEVANLLAAAPIPEPSSQTDWSRSTMSDLSDHIEQTHHVLARETLARLEPLLDKCVESHGRERPHWIPLRDVVAGLAGEMLDHLVREERVLFPWLRRLEQPRRIESGPPWSVRRPIDCMMHDHDSVGRALARIRELTHDYRLPGDACSTEREVYRLLRRLEQDTRIHIHKENNILFPAGVVAEEARAAAGAGPRGGDRRRAFSLIELLVVVAIISIVIGITLPALGSARSAGRAVVCLSNSRSVAVAMMMYADDDPKGFFPTARMPSMPMGSTPAAPFTMSWIYLLAPYVGVQTTLPDDASVEEIRSFVLAMEVCRCPEDHSQNWSAMMMPRLASYGINAYMTPNHPPHWGVRPAQIVSPSRCVLTAELTEELGSDHFMPMYWGSPPTVAHPMMQSRQWDAQTQLPRLIHHTRHSARRANYVFADGHAAAYAFSDTWDQTIGQKPARDWFNPMSQ